MKKIVLFIILLNLVGFSQDEKEQEVVGNYIELLNNYNTASTAPKLKSLSNDELLHIARMMYEAHQKHPIATYETVLRNADSVESMKGNLMEIVSYGTLQHLIREEVKSRFGMEAYNILNTPVILRVKIISKEKSTYPWEYPWGLKTDTDVLITAVVEYDLSGYRFSPNDTVKFSAAIYNSENWNRFEIDKEYIARLGFTYTYDRKFRCLIRWGCEMILVNDYVIDKDVCFINVAEMKWEELRNKYDAAVSLLSMKGETK